MAFLESFRKITLWLGHGVQGTESARAFARKLGEKRCHLIRFIFLIDSIESILLMRSSLLKKKNMLQIVGRNTIGSPVPNEREKCGPSSESGLAHDAQIGDDLLQFKVFIFQNETIQKLCV